MQSPCYAGGGCVMARAEESHYLIPHGFEGEALLASFFHLEVVFGNQCDDILVVGMGLSLAFFLRDDIGGLVHDDIARGFHIAVHFRGNVLGAGYESLETMENARSDVEGENQAVGFSDWSLGILKGVDVCSESCLSDDV